MSTGKHIIKRAVIELNVKGADKGFRAQSEVSAWFKEKIVPLVDRSLNEIDAKGQIIRVEKLELNLKKYRLRHDNGESLRRLEAEIKEKLSALLKEATANGERVTRAGIRKTTEENGPAELFFFLLKNGVLPWWISTEQRVSFELLAVEILSAPPAGFRAELIRTLMEKPARQRLVQRLPVDLFRKVLELISGKDSLLIKNFEALNDYLSRIDFSFSTHSIHRRLAEYSLESAGRQANNREQYIAGFMQELDHFPTVKELYRAIEREADENVLVITIKRALAMNNRHYLGRIKRLFTEEDRLRYFENENASGNLSRKDTKKISEAVKPDPVETAPAKINGGEAMADDDLQELQSPAEDPRRSVTDFHVGNAGLVILGPYLPAFFQELGLLEGDKFMAPEAAERAAHLLQYLVEGEESRYEEHEMSLNKVLCGLDVYTPFTVKFKLKEAEAVECRNLLQAVAANWSALRGTSGEGMRDAFFRREGVLEQQANGWNLKIEKTAIDVLVDKLPWTISIVKMPWTEGMIFVNW